MRIPRLALMKGQALMGMGSNIEAEKWLVGALDRAKEHLSLSLVWRIHWTLGKLYWSTSRPEEAERAFDAARALIDQLASTLPDEDLRSGYMGYTAALFPSNKLPRPFDPVPVRLQGRVQLKRPVVSQPRA